MQLQAAAYYKDSVDYGRQSTRYVLRRTESTTAPKSIPNKITLIFVYHRDEASLYTAPAMLMFLMQYFAREWPVKH